MKGAAEGLGEDGTRSIPRTGAMLVTRQMEESLFPSHPPLFHRRRRTCVSDLRHRSDRPQLSWQEIRRWREQANPHAIREATISLDRARVGDVATVIDWSPVSPGNTARKDSPETLRYEELAP